MSDPASIQTSETPRETGGVRLSAILNIIMSVMLAIGAVLTSPR